MASLVSLQAQGGGRIPMDGFVYDVSRRELAAIVGAMPTSACCALHVAVREGDLACAQRLLREAAQAYFTATPAAPAAHPPSPLTPRARRRASRCS